MNKTSIETESRHKGLAVVRTAEDKQNVEIYVKEAIDCYVSGEAEIRIKPVEFYDLVVPILMTLGVTVSRYEEAA